MTCSWHYRLGSCVSLLPVAQGGAVVAHAGADEAVVGGLLEAVRNPSGSAAHREERRGHPARKADHAHAYGEVEIEIRPQTLALPDRLLNLERSLEELAALA